MKQRSWIHVVAVVVMGYDGWEDAVADLLPSKMVDLPEAEQ